MSQAAQQYEWVLDCAPKAVTRTTRVAVPKSILDVVPADLGAEIRERGVTTRVEFGRGDRAASLQFMRDHGLLEKQLESPSSRWAIANRSIIDGRDRAPNSPAQQSDTVGPRPARRPKRDFKALGLPEGRYILYLSCCSGKSRATKVRRYPYTRCGAWVAVYSTVVDGTPCPNVISGHLEHTPECARARPLKSLYPLHPLVARMLRDSVNISMNMVDTLKVNHRLVCEGLRGLQNDVLHRYWIDESDVYQAYSDGPAQPADPVPLADQFEPHGQFGPSTFFWRPLLARQLHTLSLGLATPWQREFAGDNGQIITIEPYRERWSAGIRVYIVTVVVGIPFSDEYRGVPAAILFLGERPTEHENQAAIVEVLNAWRQSVLDVRPMFAPRIFLLNADADIEVAMPFVFGRDGVAYLLGTQHLFDLWNANLSSLYTAVADPAADFGPVSGIERAFCLQLISETHARLHATVEMEHSQHVLDEAIEIIGRRRGILVQGLSQLQLQAEAQATEMADFSVAIQFCDAANDHLGHIRGEWLREGNYERWGLHALTRAANEFALSGSLGIFTNILSVRPLNMFWQVLSQDVAMQERHGQRIVRFEHLCSTLCFRVLPRIELIQTLPHRRHTVFASVYRVAMRATEELACTRPTDSATKRTGNGSTLSTEEPELRLDNIMTDIVPFLPMRPAFRVRNDVAEGQGAHMCSRQMISLIARDRACRAGLFFSHTACLSTDLVLLAGPDSRCTCSDFCQEGGTCRHLFAAIQLVEREGLDDINTNLPERAEALEHLSKYVDGLTISAVDGSCDSTTGPRDPRDHTDNSVYRSAMLHLWSQPPVITSGCSSRIPVTTHTKKADAGDAMIAFVFSACLADFAGQVAMMVPAGDRCV